MNIEEKVLVAKQLARLQVDIIEAGFAYSSPGDFEAIRRIGQEVEGPVVCSLARAKPEDIDRAWEASERRTQMPYPYIPLHVRYSSQVSISDDSR